MILSLILWFVFSNFRVPKPVIPWDFSLTLYPPHSSLYLISQDFILLFLNLHRTWLCGSSLIRAFNKDIFPKWLQNVQVFLTSKWHLFSFRIRLSETKCIHNRSIVCSVIIKDLLGYKRMGYLQLWVIINHTFSSLILIDILIPKLERKEEIIHNNSPNIFYTSSKAPDNSQVRIYKNGSRICAS